jgi:hypothetical protein
VAVGRAGDGLLVATADTVTAYTADGRVRGRLTVGPGITALAQVGPWVALGFGDGGLELHRLDPRPGAPDRAARPGAPDRAARPGAPDRAARPRNPARGAVGVPFEDTPASAVVHVAPGPAGTLLAGFSDGSFGLWSLDHGHRLYRGRLHGAARHGVFSGDHLVVASDLGQHARVRLRVFHEDYCALLRRVWRAVPAVWVDGRPRRRPPPSDHRCFTPGAARRPGAGPHRRPKKPQNRLDGRHDEIMTSP